MKLFVVILMLLPGLNYGFLMPSDTICKAINDITCTVTVGGNLFLQVVNNASGCRIQFSSGSKEMFTIKKGMLKGEENPFRDRMEALVDNGTIKIQSVQWEDAKRYKVEIHHQKGAHLKTVHVTLEVKANLWPIVVFASAAVGALLVIVLISCCVYRRVKTRQRKTGANKQLEML